MEERLRLARIPNPLEGCSEQTKSWLLGRSKSTDDGQLIPKSSGVEEVLQKAKELAKKEEEGTFIPIGNKDQLTLALGTDEHRGRT
ncbi:transposon protein, putative, CACTA, En/Spm sub-class [Panicum miliaceum]|uniref:Transposon protein, putative, CACTA, En/Spm sub-class n=1 Tax=Panicum miliaceum TaxID=4540 RepID=A0A3L6TGW7_PANMI|nr:transposon protein, putative, CACTA, En/Spm sub-class [Panicum miliaceum]